jgi:hypothetical protein
MMRNFIVGVCCCCTMGWISAVWAGPLEGFAKALESGDESAVRAYLAPSVRYSRVALVGRAKVHEETVRAKSRLPFLHEIDDVEVTHRPEGDLLRIISNSALVEEWEMWVSMQNGHVVSIFEIAIEGSYPGAPAGCPDTSLRRREVATLRGPLGTNPHVPLRIFLTSQNTDAWAFTKEKSCRPKPGRYFEDVEIVAHDARQLYAFGHVGRLDRTVGGGGAGITLSRRMEGGPLTAGGARLYAHQGEGYLFLSRVWRRAHLDQREESYRVTQYALRGKRLQSVWSFDYGFHRPGESLFWSLGDPTGGIMSAHVVRSNTACPSGAQMVMEWRGRGFRMKKQGVPRGCFAAKWPGGESGLLSKGNANLDKIAQRAMGQRARAEKKAPSRVSSASDSDEEEGIVPVVEESLIH